MNNRFAKLAVVSVALAAPLAAHALNAHIGGWVTFNYERRTSSGQINLNDKQEFNEDLVPNALSSFAIAAETSDSVGAAVSARVGNGWMRFQSTALSSLFAAPVGTEAGGGASFVIEATVQDTLTIDAPGLTGTAGSASLGFSVDGVLAAATDASYPRGSAHSGGSATVGALLVADTTASGELRADVDSQRPEGPESSGLPPVVGFSDEFLGGVLNFTYGTPIRVFIGFYSEGIAYASSYDLYDTGGGLPATATLVSDFGSTITWAGVSGLRDADDNPVTDFTAFSSSGEDFRYAITAPPVPEPATVLLWAAGLTGLAFGVRRRQRPLSLSA